MVDQPLWKIWVRQWKGWHPIYDMENKKCSKPPTRNTFLSFWGLLCLKHGSLNVPIEHHPTIRYMVYNGYYKVMSNIPKMGHLPTPVKWRKNITPLAPYSPPGCPGINSDRLCSTTYGASPTAMWTNSPKIYIKIGWKRTNCKNTL